MAFMRMTNDEREEFIDGFAKYLELAEIHGTPATRAAFVAFVKSWVVSVLLREDPDWQEQVRSTSEETPDVGTTVDADGLRELLKS